MRSTSRLAAMVLLALALTGGVERKAANLNNDANKLFEAKKFDEAAKLYDEAQTRAPETPEIPYNLGNTLYRQGRIPDALEPLQRGAQSEDPVIRQRSLYNLGNALHDIGKLKESVGAYRQALVLDPTDRDAKINYEKALREMEKQQQQQQQQGGGKNDQKNQQQNQQNQGQGQQQQQDQSGEGEQQKPDDSQQQQDQQQQSQNGESQEKEKQAQEPQPSDKEPQQMAGLDSVAAGDLSREEAQRILEAMRQQETELQKEKARQQKIRSRRVEKDW